jgi:hypothetical protein
MAWDTIGKILGVLVIVSGAIAFMVRLESRVTDLEKKPYPSVQDLSTKLDSAIARVSQDETNALNRIASAADGAVVIVEQRQAELLENLGGTLNQDGSINVQGVCFKPKEMYRCYHESSGNYDHFTWFDMPNCSVGYRLEGSATLLVRC